MKLLHTMVRVLDVDASMRFYCDLLGLKEVRRNDYPQGKFTLIYLAAEEGGYEIELTHNWDETTPYTEGSNFGHIAMRVDNIYDTCQRLMDAGVIINRPPRDGHMAFIRSPDGISVELLQDGHLEPQEPWASMENTGSW